MLSRKKTMIKLPHWSNYWNMAIDKLPWMRKVAGPRKSYFGWGEDLNGDIRQAEQAWGNLRYEEGVPYPFRRAMIVRPKGQPWL